MISGENYQITGPKKNLCDLIGYLRMFVLMFVIAGDTIITALGGQQALPKIVSDIYDSVKNNKLQFFMAAFFLTSMVQTSLMQSGAFEIYMNGNLEFSKLQTGQMPDFNAIQLIYRKYGVEI